MFSNPGIPKKLNNKPIKKKAIIKVDVKIAKRKIIVPYFNEASKCLSNIGIKAIPAKAYEITISNANPIIEPKFSNIAPLVAMIP